MSLLDNEYADARAQVLDEIPQEALNATNNLLDSFSPLPRRRLLHGVVAGTAASLMCASTLGALAVHAEATSSGRNLTEFFSILATGEALFVTFYNHGVMNHQRLGIQGADLIALKAILAEEEIHLRFAQSQGGKLATTHFSFPQGAKTFEDRSVFLATQQLVEELTNGALLAWIQNMAAMGLPRLAQIGGQLMQVEGGHRVVGRVIMGANPFDNWAFGPVTLNDFLQVPEVVKKAGFLSPRPGNDFVFTPVSPNFPGVIHTKP